MEYTETQCDPIFSHHIESYWQVAALDHQTNTDLDLFIPTCTFNIVFTRHCYKIKNPLQSEWTTLLPGAYFIGQSSGCFKIKSDSPIELIGVRLKPFALSTLLKRPAFHFNESIIPLSEIMNSPLAKTRYSTSILNNIYSGLVNTELDEIINTLLHGNMTLDEKLRAQLNYIMDRQGNLKINEITEKFNTSKVTLRKHFINKVGLTPKKVCQIWRMNNILHLKHQYPESSLTHISLEAGFYDQAHFIKDFKNLLGLSPKKFFDIKTPLVQIANYNISKRFSNQYDPRCGIM